MVFLRRQNILYFQQQINIPECKFFSIPADQFNHFFAGFIILHSSKLQMPIDNCPILYPTWKQFCNFSEYVQKIDRLYKQNYGMVKVVPPNGWKGKASNYSEKLEGLLVSGPIEQNIFGKGGIYECLHIQKKSLTLRQYKLKMGVFDKITDGLAPEEVQNMFWKNIVFSPPLYGADLLNTLMDEKAGSWNLNKLDSVLNHSIDINLKGVTTPYCYVGSWKTLFCWHKQDLDLSAINYLHEGKSKFWYCIPQNQSHILQKEAKTYFPEHFSKCSEYLRHKTTLINPYNLIKKYPDLKISKTEHKANQFMLVLGGSYHCGFNFGFNIAEAVNYGTLNWLNLLPKCKSCKCSESSVKASNIQIYKNLEQSQFVKSKEFLKFKEYIQKEAEKQEEQQAKQNQQKGVKLLLSKKIKKQKLPLKIKYKGQSYQIENWARCQNCHIWRKIQKRLKQNSHFKCSQSGKACHTKQKIERNYITL